MSISEMLTGKSNKEKANIKANAYFDKIKELSKDKKYEFIDSANRKITIDLAIKGMLGGNKFFPRYDGGAEPIWLRIKTNGKFLNGDGWYGFVNPPIMVSDGIKKIIKDSKGKDIEVYGEKEDIEMALRQAIFKVVK